MTRHWWRSGSGIAIAGLLVAALLAGDADAAPPASRGGAQDAIRLQQLAKRRYQELTRIMVETSRRLEETDPKTAAAIAAAAQKAESALIADEMDKVVDLLQSGMVIPADATQANVILRLREVLQALKGQEGMEWRVFLLEELKRQMQDLGLLVERQRALERLSRMLAFGDEVSTQIVALAGMTDGLSRKQAGILEQTRRLTASPAATELGGVRQGIAAIVQRFNLAKDALFTPTPSADQLSRNIVTARRFFAEAATLRTSVRTILNREELQKALAAAAAAGATNAPAAGSNLVHSVAGAAEELQRCVTAMGTNDVAEGLLALSQAKALLQDACSSLDEMVEGFSDVRPAVAITAEQKVIDDSVSQLQPVLRVYFDAGAAVMDDTPDGDERIEGMRDRLAARITSWERQVPLLVALNPLGAATRQEQQLEKLKDWTGRLADAGREVQRLKDEPRYPAQKKDQEGIVKDLRSMQDVNKSQAATIGDDQELTQIFELLGTAVANAGDYANKAAVNLGQEQPREANTNQNDVIHLLTTVMNRVGPELKMDKNKYAMNEQAAARIERMIIKQKLCLDETRAVWKRRSPDGTFSRSDRLRTDELAKEEKSLQADIDVIWEIVNTAHNIGYNTFPAEARLMLELARVEMATAERRLSALDPGEETQRIEESILNRLKKTLVMAKQEGLTSGAKELDRRFTYDSFLSRGPINSLQRVPILTMLLALQEDVNSRTARIASARRTPGTDAAVLDAESDQLRMLQENIRMQLDDYARMDAREWMNPDRMDTQYGTSQGGTKQFFIEKGGL
jgi:hypothetical protein